MDRTVYGLLRWFPLLLGLFVLFASAPAGAATFTWASAVSGNWNDNTKWNPTGIPGTGDDVTISGGSFTVTVNTTVSIATLTLSAATVSIDSSQSLTLSGPGTSTFSSGTITGAGGFFVDGPLTWSGGTITGTGAAEVNSTGSINLPNTAAYTILDGRTLENYGTISHQAGAYYLNLYNGALLVNGSGGEFNILGDQELWTNGVPAGSPPRVENFGTFKKTGGTATFEVRPVLNNSGTLESSSGTLSINGGGTATGGTFTAASGANLDFASTYTLNNDGAGNPPAFTGTGAFRIQSGNVIAPSGVSVTIPTLTLEEGGSYLSGAGTVTLTGTATWKAGYMGHATYPSGQTIVQSGATLNIPTSNYTYLNYSRTLTNNGTISYGATTNANSYPYLHIYSGTTLNNQGTFDIIANQNITQSGTFNNSGTLRKSGDAGNSTLDPVVNNTGTVTVLSGTLSINGGGTATGGTFNASSGANLDFASTYTLNNNAIPSAPAFTGTGAFRIQSGNLVVPSGVSVTISNLSLEIGGSYLSGAGIVTLTGAATWAAGYMGHSSFPGGETIVSVGATLAIPTANYTYLNYSRTLTNNGTISYGTTTNTNYYPYLHIYSGTTLNNQGTFDIIANQNITQSGTFNNSGTLSKSGDGGNSTLDPVVNNTGSVTVMSGTLSLDGGGTHSGAFSVAASTTLAFGGNTHSIGSAGSISSSGTVLFSGGTTTVDGGYSSTSTRITGGAAKINTAATTSTYDQSGGTLGGTGAFKITGSGTWSAGTMGHSATPGGETIVDTGATLTIPTGNYTYLQYSRTLTNKGTISYGTTTNANYYPYLHIYSGTTLDNQGTFDIIANQNITQSGAFNNSGTLKKSGDGGNSTLSPVVNNTGSVNVTSGALSLEGSGTHSGAFSVAASSTLAFSGGTHTIGSTSSITSSGTLLVNGANVTVDAPYTTSGTTTTRTAVGTITFNTAVANTLIDITGGTANFNATTSAVRFAMSGGTLGGTGTVTITDTATPHTWSAGTMAGAGETIFDSGTSLAMPNTGYTYITSGRTVTNKGTITYGATTNPNYYPHLQIYSGTTLTNQGTFDIIANQSIVQTGTFNNSGTLKKSGDGGTSALSPVVNNTGSVSVTSGTLSLGGDGTHSGAFSVTASSTLAFSGGTHTIGSTGSIASSGTVHFDAVATTINGNYSSAATKITGGTARINTAASTTTYEQSGGVLGGTGTFTITGSATWSGGTMGDSTPPGGETLLDTGAALSIPTTGYTYLNYSRTLTNKGTITYGTTTNANYYPYLYIYSGTTLNNQGTFNIIANQDIVQSGTFTNSGTFQKTAGAGTTTIQPSFTNTGSIELHSGTLSFPSFPSGSGTVKIVFSGSAAAPQHGKLATTGSAALSGTLLASTPFAPTDGAEFQVLTFPSATGDFGTTLLSYTGGTFLYAKAATEVKLTADTFTSGVVVKNVNDSGTESLRQAILDANSGSCLSPCVITFDIPGAGPHTITPSTELPALTASNTVIDGESEPNYAPGVPVIEIKGANAGPTARGLTISGNNNTVKGLAINEFAGEAGIFIGSSNNTTITGCFLGTDTTGTLARPNRFGITISGGSGTNVGAATAIVGGIAGLRNLISGNTQQGIYVIGAATNAKIEGNFIGLNAAGSAALANGLNGINVKDGPQSTSILRNTIGGNAEAGIAIEGAGTANTTLQGNIIGRDASNGAPVGNTNAGVRVVDATNTFIGGTASGVANTIAHSVTGINVHGTAMKAQISGNAIYDHTSVGIDLGNNGVTTNDLNDADSGANGLQNAPVISSAVLNAGTLNVSFSVDNPSAGSHRIEMFKADGSSNAQGQLFLQSQCFVGPSNTMSIPTSSVATGDRIVGTATSYSDTTCAAMLDGTSEFSTAITVGCPAPTAPITASSTVCPNSTGNVASTPVQSGATYAWTITGGTITSATTTNSITFTAGGSGNVVLGLTVTNSCGTASNSSTLTIDALQSTVTAPAAVCAGSAGHQASVPATAGATYTWTATNATITAGQGTNGITFTAGASGPISLGVTVSSGSCSANGSASVTVNPSPTATITASGPTTFCPGGSVTLTASSGASYLWSTGATTQAITVTTSGNYSVTVTNSSGCSATSAPTAVTVNAQPVATITASGPTDLCPGGSVTLTATQGQSYLWSNGATTQSIVVNSAGSYSVTVSFGAGCSATSAPTVVTAGATPTASVTAEGPTRFCQGGSVVLTANQGASYLWSTGATTRSITVATSGDYSVTVTQSGNCSAVSAPVTVTVDSQPVVDLAAPPAADPDSTQTASVSVTGGQEPFAYQWSVAGGTLTGGQGTPAITFQTPAAGGAQSVGVSVVVTSGTCQVTADATVMISAEDDSARVPVFSATPRTIALGESATLSWSIPNVSTVNLDNGIGQKAAAGTLSVSPTQTTTYTLTAAPAGAAVITLQTTVDVVAEAAMVVTASPEGMAQAANTAEATDSFTITNVGGAAGTVNVGIEGAQGAFFAVSPSSFTLEPGASQEVIITATAQPAGAYAGLSVLSGDGIDGQIRIDVRMLSATEPDGTIILRAAVPRIDFSSVGSALIQGTVEFINEGTATFQGIAHSDQPWVTPESGVITIGAGQSRDVSFTVDPTLRSQDPGSETAEISLVFHAGAGGNNAVVGSIEPLGSGGGTQSVSVPLVHTKTPAVGGGVIPPLSANQTAWFVPGVARTQNVVTDFVALHRPASPAPANLTMFYLATGMPTGLARVATFNAVAPSSSLALSDVMRSVFNDPSPAGTVQLRTASTAPVAVSANVLNKQNAKGLFGSSLASFRGDRGVEAGERMVIPGVRNDGASATTVSIQETSGATTTARIEFLNESGQVLASRTETLEAFTAREFSDLTPAGAVTAVVTNTNGGRIVAWGLVSETASGDLTNVVDWTARNAMSSTEAQIIPFVAANTEVVIANRGTDVLRGTLTLVGARGGRRRAVRGGTSSGGNGRLDPESNAAGLELAPGQSRVIGDVLAELRAAAGPASYLVFTPQSGSAAITARVRTTSSTFGAFSSMLPVVSTSSSLRRAEAREFGGVDSSASSTVAKRQAGTFQSALGLIETAGSAVTVRATLQFTQAAGSGLASVRGSKSKDYALKAGEFLHVEDVATDILGPVRAQFNDLRNMHLDIVVVSGSGAVAPIVAATENGTGDIILRVE